MLSLLRADNYKSLLDFEFRPPRLSVLIGENGSGKTSIGALLQAIRSLIVEGKPVTECFPWNTLCRWTTKFAQRISFELESPIHRFRYELEILHDSQTTRPQITVERLSSGEKLLYEFFQGTVRIGSNAFSFDNQRSFMPYASQDTARSILGAFPEAVAKMAVLRPEPARITSRSEAEELRLTADCSNYSSWYRWFTGAKTDRLKMYFDLLSAPLAGFRTLLAKDVGPGLKRVVARFLVGTTEVEFLLEELSEGQRQLLLLYLLVSGLQEGDVLFLDEPDNFLSIREVQPWLSELDSALERMNAQAIVVSHGPEAMDYLGSRAAYQVTRPGGAATQLRLHDGKDGEKPSDFLLYGSHDSEAASA